MGSEAEDEVNDEAASEDEEEQTSSKPYMTLIRSLAESAAPAPRAKRRKLDHPDTRGRSSPPAQAAGSEEDDDEEEEEEEGENDQDLVDEGPEDGEDDVVMDDLVDEEDQGDSTDPFQTHFADPDETDYSPKLKAIEQSKWATKSIAAKPTRTVVMAPQTGDDIVPTAPAVLSGPGNLKLKQKLREIIDSKHPTFDATEQAVAPLLFQYYDTLYCNRTVSNAESLRRMACLHALNHVFKWVGLFLTCLS